MRNDISTCESDGLTIAEMSRLYGVTFRRLRFYEEIGLLEPRRVDQKRLYSEKDKTRLETVLSGRRLGFSLRELGNMIRSRQVSTESKGVALVEALDVATIARQISSLECQRADVEQAIAELKATLKRPDLAKP